MSETDTDFTFAPFENGKLFDAILKRFDERVESIVIQTTAGDVISTREIRLRKEDAA